MSIGLLFWILYIVGVVFFGIEAYRSRAFGVGDVALLVLIALLGVGTFGGPIK